MNPIIKNMVIDKGAIPGLRSQEIGRSFRKGKLGRNIFFPVKTSANGFAIGIEIFDRIAQSGMIKYAVIRTAGLSIAYVENGGYKKE